jgi:hypothetical protein
MFTSGVTRWTALALLRFRYRFLEEIEEFAEEIVLAAFERGQNGPSWLKPLPTAARDLAQAAEPQVVRRRNEAAEGFDVKVLRETSVSSSPSPHGVEWALPR